MGLAGRVRQPMQSESVQPHDKKGGWPVSEDRGAILLHYKRNCF